MDNGQRRDSYINIPSSQTYRPYLRCMRFNEKLQCNVSIWAAILYESVQRTSTNFRTDKTGTVCFRVNYSALQTFSFCTFNLTFMSIEYTE
jgi:hypothetical protein